MDAKAIPPKSVTPKTMDQERQLRVKILSKRDTQQHLLDQRLHSFLESRRATMTRQQ